MGQVKFGTEPKTEPNCWAVYTSSPELGMGVSRDLVRSYYPSWQQIESSFDALKFNERDSMNKLLGNAKLIRESREYNSCRGGLGLFDTPLVNNVIIQNAENLSLKCQDAIARCLKNGGLKRVGAKREIHVCLRVFLVCGEPGKKMKLSKSLDSLVSGNIVKIPELNDWSEPWLKVFQKSLSSIKQGTAESAPSIRILFPKLKPNLCWSNVENAINVWSSSNRCDFEIEDSGVPLLESRLTSISSKITRQKSGDGTFTTWKEFACLSLQVYVCRVLSATGGNIKMASELSGLSRPVFYEVLKELGEESSVFQINRLTH